MNSDESLHPVISGEKVSFESFLPFVKVGDPKLKEWFVGKLRELYKIDGDIWKPGSCYATENMKEDIEKAQCMGKLKELDFEARSHYGNHYFIVFKHEGGELIVDPFGVPPSMTSETEWMKNSRIITPFFGDVDLAPVRHQHVYKNSKKEEIFHHFHP